MVVVAGPERDHGDNYRELGVGAGRGSHNQTGRDFDSPGHVVQLREYRRGQCSAHVYLGVEWVERLSSAGPPRVCACCFVCYY